MRITNNDLKLVVRRFPLALAVLRPGFRTARTIAAYPSGRRAARSLIRQLRALEPGPRRIWYFGVPTHPNLGDQAQKFCILDWLGAAYPKVEIVRISSKAFNGGTGLILRLLRRLVGERDLIVMQSGYTMDGLHPDERAHQLVPQQFPGTRIVFFPQTILFRSLLGQKRDQQALAAHGHLLLLARDVVSYQTAVRVFPGTRVELFPDIVTTLIGKYDFSRSERTGVLLCARNDGEKHYDSHAIARLAESIGRTAPVEISDTTVDWPGTDFDSREAWQRIESVFEAYSRYKVVITDRYHGTIFSLIAGTPVIVLKTTDHKVVGGAKWFDQEGADHVYVADSLDAADVLARELLEGKGTYRVGVTFPGISYGSLAELVEAL